MNGGLLPVVIAGITPFLVITLIVLGVGFHVVEWQPPAQWTSHFGSPLINQVTSLSGDSQGLYAAGYVNGSVSGSTPFVAKYDLNGHKEWNQSFGTGYNFPHVESVVSGVKGLYASGFGFPRNSACTSTCGLVEKYEFNGSIGWLESLGSDVSGITLGADGIYAAGYNYTSPVYSYFLRTYDFTGQIVSTNVLTDSSVFSVVSVYSDQSGIYVAGLPGVNGAEGLLRHYDSAGSLIWSSNCSCEDISTDAGGIYVGAISPGSSIGNSNAIISKYDWNGNQFWNRTIPAPDGTTVGAVNISADASGLYLALTTNSAGFLSRYDSSGNLMWSFAISRSLDAVWAGSSNVYVGGKDTVSKDLGGSAFISEYSTSSSLILFGVNPPWSFVMVAGLAGVAGFSIIWFRRQTKQRAARRKTVPSRSPRPKEDEASWLKRGP